MKKKEYRNECEIKMLKKYVKMLEHKIMQQITNVDDDISITMQHSSIK